MIRPRRLYALRNPVERFMNRLKNLRRVATRYDQTTSSFLAFVLLGCARAWIAHIGPE
jgi:transposase